MDKKISWRNPCGNHIEGFDSDMDREELIRTALKTVTEHHAMLLYDFLTDFQIFYVS